MSPEQAAGEVVDARSDLWSLGVVTHEMLAGRRPFDGTNALAIINAVLTTTPAPVRALRPDVARPAGRRSSTGRMVRNRDRRTITAADVRDLASACHAQLSSGAQPPVDAVADVAPRAARGRCRRARRRRQWHRMVGAAQLRRCAGRGRKRCRRLSGWPARTSSTPPIRLAQQAQPYIPDDPLLAEQIRGSPDGRSSTPIRPAPMSSTARTAGATSRGGRSGRRRSPAPACHAGCCTGKSSWRATRSAEDVGPGPFSSTAHIRFTLFPPDKVPAGMVRIASPNRDVQIVMPTP